MDRITFIHGICHFYGQWIPGDERGFRSVDHKVHSSGDYRNPPPTNEHEGLRRYTRALMQRPPVTLHNEELPVIGTTFLAKLLRMQSVVRVLSCSVSHVHVLCSKVEPDAKKQMGKAKQYASLQLKSRPGSIWGEGCSIITVRDNAQHARAFKYICDHALKEGAWIWRDDLDQHPRF